MLELPPAALVAVVRRLSSFGQITCVIPVTSITSDKSLRLHLKREVDNQWKSSNNLTRAYLDILHEIATSRTSFKGKNALLTGVGKASIGVEIGKRDSQWWRSYRYYDFKLQLQTVEYYQAIYHAVGSRGFSLTVVPFNQGSKQDVETLVEYIYSTLGRISITSFLSRELQRMDGLEDRSELTYRMMLVNPWGRPEQEGKPSFHHPRHTSYPSIVAKSRSFRQ